MPCASRLARIGAASTDTASALRPARASSPISGAAEVELAGGRGVVAGRGVRRVVLEHVAELVPRLGRAQQVGGDRRVELQTAHVDALQEQRTHQRLGVVAVEANGPKGRTDGVVAEMLGRDPQHRVRLGTAQTRAVSAAVTTARPVTGARPGSPS